MNHLTSEEREMIGRTVWTETFWVWTEATERLYPDRKAGMPVFVHHRKSVPLLWIHRGYVREASQPYQLKLDL